MTKYIPFIAMALLIIYQFWSRHRIESGKAKEKVCPTCGGYGLVIHQMARAAGMRVSSALESEMSERLLNCPFCGGEAYVKRTGTNRVSCMIGCRECHCELESNELGAGEAWNRRATLLLPDDVAKLISETQARLIRQLVAALESQSRERFDAESVLRSLASWLGNGGYNAETVDADVFERKIRYGVETVVRVETKRAEQRIERKFLAEPRISDDEMMSLLRRVNKEFELEVSELRGQVESLSRERAVFTSLLRQCAIDRHVSFCQSTRSFEKCSLRMCSDVRAALALDLSFS